MKNFVLCRHAKSEWPDGVPDLERPLKARGINDATRLGQLLASQQFIPDIIISSPAQRALETAQLIGKFAGYHKNIVVESSVYHEGPGSLIALIQDLPDEVNTAMIFGHNPTMEQAVRFLLQADAPFEMPTSGMACFETYLDNWKSITPQNTHLRWYLIPRLRRKGY